MAVTSEIFTVPSWSKSAAFNCSSDKSTKFAIYFCSKVASETEIFESELTSPKSCSDSAAKAVAVPKSVIAPANSKLVILFVIFIYIRLQLITISFLSYKFTV